MLPFQPLLFFIHIITVFAIFNADCAKSRVLLCQALLRRLGAAGQLWLKIILRGIFCQNAPLPKTVRSTVFEIHP